MMLEIDEGGFVYLDRGVYDACIILSYRLEDDITILANRFGVDVNSVVIDEFYRRAPEPLNVLAPYLGLVRKDIEQDFSMKQMCGFLHCMSQVINFNNYSLAPKAVAAELTFSKYMLTGYERDWSEKLEVVKVMEYVPMTRQPMTPSNTYSTMPLPTTNNYQETVTNNTTSESNKDKEIEDLWAEYDDEISSIGKNVPSVPELVQDVNPNKSEEVKADNPKSDISEVDKIISLFGGV